MRPVTESEIRTSFINCSKGETKRAALPRNLEELPWDDLDFLGWREPGAPERGYLVAERAGGLVGIALRAAPAVARGFTSRSMCSLCLAVHNASGVAMMTARRPGEAGRLGNTVGQYLCADLACSLYLRGRRKTGSAAGLNETLSVEDKIARARLNLLTFLDKVTE